MEMPSIRLHVGLLSLFDCTKWALRLLGETMACFLQLGCRYGHTRWYNFHLFARMWLLSSFSLRFAIHGSMAQRSSRYALSPYSHNVAHSFLLRVQISRSWYASAVCAWHLWYHTRVHQSELLSQEEKWKILSILWLHVQSELCALYNFMVPLSSLLVPAEGSLQHWRH